MPARNLAPAAGGLLEVIRTAADLVDRVGDDRRDANAVDLALDVLGDIAIRRATDEHLAKSERGEY